MRPAVAGLPDGRRPRGVLGVLGVRLAVVAPGHVLLRLADAVAVLLFDLSLPTSVFPVGEVFVVKICINLEGWCLPTAAAVSCSLFMSIPFTD